MSQYLPDREAAPEIEDRRQLVEFFRAAAKPRERWGIGTEYEKLAVRPDGTAVPFSGPRGIERLLRLLGERSGWEPVEEDGRVVALLGGPAAITLEPGGQLELSGRICDSVHCAREELSRHLEEVVTLGRELDIVFVGLGIQPVSPPEAIEMVPKQRYRIMAPYMRRVGRLGHRMMLQTATVQVNLDYADEADAVWKMRVGMGLVPILSAMFANSPIADGRTTGFRSYRGHIWTRTDPDRCGLLPFVFHSQAGFDAYVDYALDVPMYFIVRGGRWLDMTRYTFRRFLEEGCEGFRATMADWALHLTTLFPEVRLKSYIELRPADGQGAKLALAIPALAKGVFYEDDCLLAAWDLVKRWSWSERLELYHAAHREGLGARARRVPLVDLARELTAIARTGLARHGVRDEGGRDETRYLVPLERLLEARRSPADRLLERWEGEWAEDPACLVRYTAYAPEA